MELTLAAKSGRIIHIEMRVEKEAWLRNRILYYTARLLRDQLKQGEEYDKVQQVISIIICNHKLLEEEKFMVSLLPSWFLPLPRYLNSLCISLA